jgi:hypothetical protein
MPTAPTFTCEFCGHTYPWKARNAGRKAKCQCGQILTVPAVAPPGPPEPVVEPPTVEPPAPEPPAPAQVLPVEAPAKAAPVVTAVAAAGAATCPNCHATLPLGAVLCVQCGLNLQTGQSLATTEAPADAGEAARASKVPAVLKNVGSPPRWVMLTCLVILLSCVLFGAGYRYVYLPWRNAPVEIAVGDNLIFTIDIEGYSGNRSEAQKKLADSMSKILKPIPQTNGQPNRVRVTAMPGALREVVLTDQATKKQVTVSAPDIQCTVVVTTKDDKVLTQRNANVYATQLNVNLPAGAKATDAVRDASWARASQQFDNMARQILAEYNANRAGRGG